MKLGKLSLVAVMALGTSAFAIDNVKVNGEAKLIYQTSDVQLTATESANGAETGMFTKGTIGNNASLPGAPYSGGAAGGASLTMGLTADLLSNVSFGSEVQMYSTLGLENNLVSDTMAPGGATAAARIQDSWSMSQMWLASTYGKTTFKVGRMELDTPMAFTEKWNIVKNTFEGAVVLNNDLPETTLVAAWVGKHNGANDPVTLGGIALGVNTLSGSTGRTANLDGAAGVGGSGSNPYVTFGTDGAYAVAAVNKSIPNTTVQAWYYDVVQIADAVWLQADTKIAGMVSLGGQYAVLSPKTNLENAVFNALGVYPEDSKIWSVKAAADVAGVNVYAAYSDAQDGGVLGFANVSTGDKTKIYTGDGSIYMDGIVTAPGTQACKVGASTKVMDVAVSASYTVAKDSFNVDGNEISAWDVSASTKVGPIGLTAIYTQVSNDDAATEVNPNATLGVAGNNNFYGGRDVDSLRIIASLKF